MERLHLPDILFVLLCTVDSLIHPDSRIFMFGGLRDGQFLDSSLHGLKVENSLLKNLGELATRIVFSNQSLDRVKDSASAKNNPVSHLTIQPKRGESNPGLQPDMSVLVDTQPNGPSQNSNLSPGHFVSFKPLPDSFIQKNLLRKMTTRYYNNDT